jgi:phenylalanyl-tRNA synthetase beta chain
VLRLAQIPRILGIDVPRPEVERILAALGLAPRPASGAASVSYVPPTWRRDLTREIDLVEEVARVHGYEKIPEDVLVPLEVSTTTPHDRLSGNLADLLVGAGFCEAITLSFVSEELVELFRPWTDAAPLRVEHTSRQRENVLRQSLIPSLLVARRHNERQRQFGAELFEMARIYLAAEPGRAEAEPKVLAFVSGRSFGEMKGLVEALVDATNHSLPVTSRPAAVPQFTPGRGAELLVGGKRLGWLGELSDETRAKLDLHDPVTVAELDLGVLEAHAEFEPAYTPVPEFPAIERDLNFVLDEAVAWQEVEDVVRSAAGPLLESITFEDQYRGPQIPPAKKSYVMRLHYRAADRTLTTEEVEPAQQAIVDACRTKLGATLR